MNKELLEVIATWLEMGAPPRCGVGGFDMHFVWGYGAAPSVCIAGAALAFSGCPLYTSRAPQAAKILGIEAFKAYSLFFPRIGISYDNFTAEWAARCIRHLIATGEVDWEGTRNAS